MYKLKYLLQFSLPSFCLWPFKIMSSYLWDYEFFRGKKISSYSFKGIMVYLIEKVCGLPSQFPLSLCPFPFRVSTLLLRTIFISCSHSSSSSWVYISAHPCLSWPFPSSLPHSPWKVIYSLLHFLRFLISLSFTKFSKEFSLCAYFSSSPTNSLTHF